MVRFEPEEVEKDFKQTKAAVKVIVSLGWRCNVETCAKIVELIDKM